MARLEYTAYYCGEPVVTGSVWDIANYFNWTYRTAKVYCTQREAQSGKIVIKTSENYNKQKSLESGFFDEFTKGWEEMRALFGKGSLCGK